MLATAVASGIFWATYAFLVGRLGGHAFSDRPWAGLVLALVVVLGVSVVIELGRRTWRWQRSRSRPPPARLGGLQSRWRRRRRSGLAAQPGSGPAPVPAHPRRPVERGSILRSSTPCRQG